MGKALAGNAVVGEHRRQRFDRDDVESTG